MEQGKHYYENADTLRGFAILLVILGHAVAKENIVRTDSILCNEIYNFIYSFHMPLFFIISGFCYTRYMNYKDFLLRKCRYLLIPYFVFCFLTMAVQRLLPFFTLVENDFFREIKQIFLYGGSIWFVYVLFEIMLIFPMIERVIGGKLRRAALVLAAAMIVYVLLGNRISFLCIAQLTYYMPFFIMGHMLRILRERRNSAFVTPETPGAMPAAKRCARIAAVLTMLCIDFGIYYVRNRVAGIPYISYLFRVVCAIAGSMLSYMLILSLHFEKMKWFLKQLGKYSLQLYLFNGYFIAVSRTILVGVCNVSNTFVIATVNFIVGLAVNYIWCYYILKVRFVKLLCGKR